MHLPTASHRTVLLLALVALGERGLSYSRGNLNLMGLAAFALVLAGLTLLVLGRANWQGSSETRGGFHIWPAALPWVYVYILATSGGRHLLIFAPDVVRGLLSHITLAAAVLALPVALLAWEPCRRRLQPGMPTILVLLPLLPVVVLFLIVPLASPRASIDVYHFQDQAAQALLQGVNPYTITFVDHFGATQFYPGGIPDSYPYPPLSFLSALLGHALGDIRWPLIACHFGASALLYAAARTRKLPAYEAVILASLFLYLPWAPFVSEQAWTDPTVTLALGGMSFFLARRQPRAALWAAGLALALKQTMVLLLPLLWGLWRRVDRAGLVAVFSIAAVSYGAFLLWDPISLWDDVVAFHMATPFRDNALTLSAFYVWLGGSGPLPSWLSLFGIVGGCAAGLHALRPHEASSPSPHDAVRVSVLFTGLAFTYLLTLLLSKHAFMNYYYVLQYALVAALVWSRIADVDAAAETEPA